MGMYTEMAFSAELSAEGVRVVSRLRSAQEARTVAGLGTSPWEDVMEDLESLHTRLDPAAPSPRMYLEDSRSRFIPFGFGVRRPLYREEGSTWTVRCSLKNYNGTIELFLSTVLPLLIDKPTRVDVQHEAGPPKHYLVPPAGWVPLTQNED